MATSKIKSNTTAVWTNLPNQPSASINSARYMVRGEVCYLNLYDNKTLSLTKKTWYALGVFPTGLRPSISIRSSWANRDGTGGEIMIEANGTVSINANADGTQFISAIVPVPIG